MYSIVYRIWYLGLAWYDKEKPQSCPFHIEYSIEWRVQIIRQFQSVFHQNNTWTRVIKAIRESRTDCISFDFPASSLAISETDRIKLLTSLGINMTLLANRPTIIKAPACIWRNGEIWLNKYNQLNDETWKSMTKVQSNNQECGLKII